MKYKSVNIAEIAKIADVHPSTVSRALNGSSLISEKTRKWIEDIASEHGYIPDAVAKSLSRGETSTIGIIVPEISNAFYSHIVDAVEKESKDLGYGIIISGTHFDSQAEQCAIRSMAGKRVDALILCAASAESNPLLMSISHRLPVVLCDTMWESELFDTVYVDETAGILEAVRYLQERGHRDIGYIADNATKRRIPVFADVMESCGLKLDEEFTYHGETLSAECGYDGLKTLMSQKRKPTAICTARDSIAIGAMRAAIDLTVDIPRDLSIVGYDDINTASYLHKKLTTIHQPADEIGEIAARLALGRINSKIPFGSPTCVKLIPKLVVRESTD